METNTQYHADTTHVSKSMLTTFGKSRREYHRQYVLGQRDKPTVAMQLGTLFHLAVLEPDKYDEAYCEVPKEFATAKGAVSEGVKAVAWIEANADGRIAVTRQQLDDLACMATVVRDALGDTIEKAAIERSVRDPERKLKCRPDLMFNYPAHIEIIDLKSARDASSVGFQKASREFEYALQHVHYSDIVSRRFGKPVQFSFLVVENGEKDKYFRCAWHEIKKQELLDEAMAVRTKRLEQIAACHASGDWKESWEIRGKIGEGAVPTAIEPRTFVEQKSYSRGDDDGE
jgi:hypothetical protein